MDFKIKFTKDGRQQFYVDDKRLDNVSDYRKEGNEITITFDADSVYMEMVEYFSDDDLHEEVPQYQALLEKEERQRDRIKIGLKIATMIVELAALAVLIAGVVWKSQQ